MAIFCSVEPTEKSIAVGASKSVISKPLELLTTTHETPQSQITNCAEMKYSRNNLYYQPAGCETSIQTLAGGEEAYNPRLLGFSHKKFTRSEPKPLLLQQAAASSLVSAKKQQERRFWFARPPRMPERSYLRKATALPLQRKSRIGKSS